jgi:serine protease Do
MIRARIKIILLCFLSTFVTGIALAEDFLTRLVPESRQQMSLSFAPLVKKSTPAVVNIYTRKKTLVRTISPFFNDPFFNQFFGNQFSGGIRENIENSLGSGVIIKSNGLIITNNHVIKDADQINIILSDKREFDAKIVLTDERADLALLQIDTQGERLPNLELANSDIIEVGDLVLAIGNPFGVGQTVTSGIVSAMARTTVGVNDYQFFIQTDAPINPGNSGGALINMEGKLIGVNTAIFSNSGGSHGIGFAIPANMVATVVNSVASGHVKHGHVIRPWLGASTQNVTKEIVESLNSKTHMGTIVNKVYEGSPADAAGLKIGDIITHVDDYEITDDQALKFRIATYGIGKEVKFKVLRNDEIITLNVKMAAPKEIPARDTRTLKGRHPLSGLVVANMSPALAEELSLKHEDKSVVVINILPNDFGISFGLKKGDYIELINGVTVTSTKQLEKLISMPAKGWDIAIKREGRILKLSVH